MKNKLKIFLFPLIILLVLFNSCQKVDPTTTPGGIDEDWTVVSWKENGVSQPTGTPQGTTISQYQITLSLTNLANKTGTMTFNSPVIPFNYTGSYSMDQNNLLTATLNETTGNMEINQWNLSMNATIGSNNLELDGSILEKSPFWPDTTVNVVFEATR